MSQKVFTEDMRTYMVVLCMNELHHLREDNNDAVRCLLAHLGGPDTVLVAHHANNYPLRVGEYPVRKLQVPLRVRYTIVAILSFWLGLTWHHTSLWFPIIVTLLMMLYLLLVGPVANMVGRRIDAVTPNG